MGFSLGSALLKSDAFTSSSASRNASGIASAHVSLW
jgi:hypothetical protein